MSETYTVFAKTVDEAVELATKLYGGDGKEISHEIVNLPKRGFLGLGSKDAEIKVTVSDSADDELGSIVNEIKNYKKHTAPERGYYTDEPEQAAEEKAVKAAPQKSKKKPQNQQKSSDKPAEAAEKTPVAPSIGSQKSDIVEDKPARAPKGNQKQNSDNRAKADHTPAPRSAASEEEMVFAVDFINLMIKNMELEAVAAPKNASAQDEFICTPEASLYPEIEIEGADTGILIGHHGETLDAIQYLVNLALFRRSGASRNEREHLKITVDIENYRAKREETLRALARRMAARAVKYKKNIFLEPMNPYERRIIHAELQEYPDVATHSVGSDTSRKIIITYEGADKERQNTNTKRRPRTDRKNTRNNRSASGAQNRAKAERDDYMSLPTEDDIPLPTLDDINI